MEKKLTLKKLGRLYSIEVNHTVNCYEVMEVSGTKILKVGETLTQHELNELKKYTKFEINFKKD